MSESVIRFLVSGSLVSLFAIIGDIVRPKSFAGLFGAAPSVALATLGIAWSQHGVAYVEIQARTMILGAIALAVYSAVVCWLLMRCRIRALPATIGAFAVWLAVAFCLYLPMGAGGP